MKDSKRIRKEGKTREELGRLDLVDQREKLLPFCRLSAGEIWEDPLRGHRIGVLDAASASALERLFAGEKADCLINDPPYNIAVGGKATGALFKKDIGEYLAFSRQWVGNALSLMNTDAHFFVWLGADYRDNFQPLPDFMLLMRQMRPLRPKNFITVRNQRGYGTQKNWMWIRQELLHYVQGEPFFKVIYTDIPKILKGYYKVIGKERMENLERSKSPCIRAGNVWVDIQQVFYRMEENVPGCYAQKPLKAVERVISAATKEGMLVGDFFAHSGTTLIAGERLGRRVCTCDCDPVFAEIAIRRLEHFRKTGKTGFQWHTPFPEIL
jgi:site-specific DNA-methyltransferase (adenine-specific)